MVAEAIKELVVVFVARKFIAQKLRRSKPRHTDISDTGLFQKRGQPRLTKIRLPAHRHSANIDEKIDARFDQRTNKFDPVSLLVADSVYPCRLWQDRSLCQAVNRSVLRNLSTGRSPTSSQTKRAPVAIPKPLNRVRQALHPGRVTMPPASLPSARQFRSPHGNFNPYVRLGTAAYRRRLVRPVGGGLAVLYDSNTRSATPSPGLPLRTPLALRDPADQSVRPRSIPPDRRAERPRKSKSATYSAALVTAGIRALRCAI